MYKEQIRRVFVVVKGMIYELPYELADALCIGEKRNWNFNWNLKRLKQLDMDENGQEKKRILEQIIGAEAPFGHITYVLEKINGDKIKLSQSEAYALFIGERTNWDYNEMGRFGISIPKQYSWNMTKHFQTVEKKSENPHMPPTKIDDAKESLPASKKEPPRITAKDDGELLKMIEKVANDPRVNIILRDEARRAMLVLKYETEPEKVVRVETEWKKWFKEGSYGKSIKEEAEFQLNRSKFFEKISPLERKKAIWAKKRTKTEEEAIKREEALLKQRQDEKKKNNDEKRKVHVEAMREREEEKARLEAQKRIEEMEWRKEWLDKKLSSFLKEQRTREKDRSYGIDAIHLARGTEEEKENVRKKYSWKIKEFKKDRKWE